jgi:hypothetical protein
MLSPKATNCVRLICCERCTTTLKVQDAARWRESVAVHRTAVVPIGNADPLDGAQFTMTPLPVATGLP